MRLADHYDWVAIGLFVVVAVLGYLVTGQWLAFIVVGAFVANLAAFLLRRRAGMPDRSLYWTMAGAPASLAICWIIRDSDDKGADAFYSSRELTSYGFCIREHGAVSLAPRSLLNTAAPGPKRRSRWRGDWSPPGWRLRRCYRSSVRGTREPQA